MENIVDRFIAVDENGNEYELSVYQKIVEARTRGGTHRMPGMKRISTSDGLSVNRIDDDTYKIVLTDQILRKR